ncbi:hypothetical protein [Aquipuribacter sp. MA13-6]|uniref:hypothetical protein n=1 Tax=unclassified Aquipuribacter TaxID=2635084 RepID=UPI003EEBC25C
MSSIRELSDWRQDFAFEPTQEPMHPHDGTVVCQTILTRLRPHLVRAEVDAYSDYAEDVPPDVRDVEAKLTELGRTQSRGRQDPGMAVVLDLLDVEQWEALVAYAAWSINAELWGPDARDMGTFHDSSQSIVAALTAADLEALSEPLRTYGHFTAIAELDAKRLADKQARRAARRARRAAFLRALIRRP